MRLGYLCLTPAVRWQEARRQLLMCSILSVPVSPAGRTIDNETGVMVRV
jgi:hypothetical protein